MRPDDEFFGECWCCGGKISEDAYEHAGVNWFTCIVRHKMGRVCVGCMHWHKLWEFWMG